MWAISACMIVKNEEKDLPRCLASIRDFVDEIVIVDTGSEDGTIKIAEDFGARVFEHPWENHFSKHRNQSIGYAQGDWIFIMDADEELYPDDGPKLKGFVRSCSDSDAMLVPVKSVMKGGGKSVHNSIRLFKNRMNIHYEGRVHNEVVGVHTARYFPVRIRHYGYNLDDVKSKEKSERTVKLLLRDIVDNPENPAPHHYLSVSFMSENRYEEAIREAETAIILAKKYGYLSDLYSGSYFVVSSAYLALGIRDRAEYWAREALERYPRHLDSLFILSKIYFELRDIPLFWEYIKRYLDLLRQIEATPEEFGTNIFFTTGSKWLGHLYRGCVWIDEGRIEKGEEELGRALEYCPDKPHYHHLMAGYYLQRKAYEKSESQFAAALQKSPHRAEILWDFSRLYKEKNDPDNEKKWLEKLIELNPQDKSVLFALGVIYFKKSDFNKALHIFKGILKRDENHIEARLNMALCLRKLGRFEEAIHNAQAVIEDQPSSMEALSNLAYSYYSMNDYDNALKFFHEMTRIDPDQMDAHVYLSLISLLNQDIESCVVSCDHLLRILNLKRNILLHSPADLGNRFLAIGKKIATVDMPHLSGLCNEIGGILTQS